MKLADAPPGMKRKELRRKLPMEFPKHRGWRPRLHRTRFVPKGGLVLPYDSHATWPWPSAADHVETATAGAWRDLRNTARAGQSAR